MLGFMSLRGVVSLARETIKVTCVYQKNNNTRQVLWVEGGSSQNLSKGSRAEADCPNRNKEYEEGELVR